MNNKMKMLAIVAVLVSSVAQVDAGRGVRQVQGRRAPAPARRAASPTLADGVRGLASDIEDAASAVAGVARNEAHASWDWKAVKKLNKVHPWFPGTYPLNEIKEGRDTNWIHPSLWEQSFVREGARSIHPSIQLGFTVLLKWLPVALIVRGIYKVATKKKKKHHKKHDKKAHHVALNA
ncbi:hypothetical protein E3J61_03460 [Candidatus Dependentiae bacterium]|nr:MAG: hypothetical protein E3J61_03460 [Candidatus Dependentiae bacterium]